MAIVRRMKPLERADRVMIDADDDDVIGAAAMMIRKFLHMVFFSEMLNCFAKKTKTAGRT